MKNKSLLFASWQSARASLWPKRIGCAWGSRSALPWIRAELYRNPVNAAGPGDAVRSPSRHFLSSFLPPRETWWAVCFFYVTERTRACTLTQFHLLNVTNHRVCVSCARDSFRNKSKKTKEPQSPLIKKDLSDHWVFIPSWSLNSFIAVTCKRSTVTFFFK